MHVWINTCTQELYYIDNNEYHLITEYYNKSDGKLWYKYVTHNCEIFCMYCKWVHGNDNIIIM